MRISINRKGVTDAPLLLYLNFHFQKFRLEVFAVKYAPRKVYIKESNGYAELSNKN